MSAARPIFHLLAGPNGAGKSTLYRAHVSNGGFAKTLEFVNADVYEQSHLERIADLQKRSEAARDWANSRREALLNTKTSFVSETVFSHESKLVLITKAQAMGFDVVLYVVSVGDPQRLLARVSQRVREGGHNVPAQRVLDRYPRTMANLKKAVRLATWLLFMTQQTLSKGRSCSLRSVKKQKPPDWQTNCQAGPLPCWTMPSERDLETSGVSVV